MDNYNYQHNLGNDFNFDSQNNLIPENYFLDINKPIEENNLDDLNNFSINLIKPESPNFNIIPKNQKTKEQLLRHTGVQCYNLFGPLKPINTVIDGIMQYNINIIFYNEDTKKFSEFNDNCSYFKINLEGTFYGISNFNLFKYVCHNIQKEDKPYILISSGSCAEKIFSYCYKKNISNIYIFYIYCRKIENYLQLKGKYKELNEIFTNFNDLTTALFNNPTIIFNRPLNSSSLIFTEQYNRTYIKLHFEIIKKYFLYKTMKSNNCDQSKFLELIRNKRLYYQDLAKELLFNDDETIVRYLKSNNIATEDELRKVFNYNHNIENYISNYTVESFYYRVINKFLREGDLKSFRLLANHIAKFIYHLKEYRKKIFQSNIPTLFRSMLISREELEVYKNSIGKVICYPSFTSTSTKIDSFNPKNINSIPNPILVKLIINQNNSQQIIKISELSEYKSEEEYLCLPFSFFKITQVFCRDENNYIYLTALNSEKPLEEMYLEFMKNEKDNLDPEGLEMIQLINNNTTIILNPVLKYLIHDEINYNY